MSMKIKITTVTVEDEVQLVYYLMRWIEGLGTTDKFIARIIRNHCKRLKILEAPRT